MLGLEQPYYEVVYNDGTKCDLTGQPRKSAVRYVCHEEGRGEIYELKETSSCEYEVVVLSKELCLHTTYGWVFSSCPRVVSHNDLLTNLKIAILNSLHVL